jgi:hypothetical protein
MAIKHTNIFQSKALQNRPSLGVLVSKITTWQPCVTEREVVVKMELIFLHRKIMDPMCVCRTYVNTASIGFMQSQRYLISHACLSLGSLAQLAYIGGDNIDDKFFFSPASNGFRRLLCSWRGVHAMKEIGFGVSD